MSVCSSVGLFLKSFDVGDLDYIEWRCFEPILGSDAVNFVFILVCVVSLYNWFLFTYLVAQKVTLTTKHNDDEQPSSMFGKCLTSGTCG